MRTATATTPQLDQPSRRRDVVGGRARRNPQRAGAAVRVAARHPPAARRGRSVVPRRRAGPHLLGYRTATMLTGSMSPGINPGDVIVSTRSRPRTSRSVTSSATTSRSRTTASRRNRIVRVTTGRRRPARHRHQGDEPSQGRPWVATLEGDTVWQTRAVIPHAGTVIRALREPFVQT